MIIRTPIHFRTYPSAEQEQALAVQLGHTALIGIGRWLCRSPLTDVKSGDLLIAFHSVSVCSPLCTLVRDIL
jgi:hypothetical protein